MQFNTEFLAKASWKLDNATGNFQTTFDINDKFCFSIITGPWAHSNNNQTFEVALIHTASADIITVRGWQSVSDIAQFAEDVMNQKF